MRYLICSIAATSLLFSLAVAGAGALADLPESWSFAVDNVAGHLTFTVRADDGPPGISTEQSLDIDLGGLRVSCSRYST